MKGAVSNSRNSIEDKSKYEDYEEEWRMDWSQGGEWNEDRKRHLEIIENSKTKKYGILSKNLPSTNELFTHNKFIIEKTTQKFR